MSPPPLQRPQIELCFPRVSGDEPASGQVEPAPSLFSPRERG